MSATFLNRMTAPLRPLRPPAGRPSRSLVVICHPRPDSLTHAAAARVQVGLATRGDEVRVIDLDAENFDPALGDVTGDHGDALSWADRVIIVHPTWFSGHPARLAAWFETLWILPNEAGAGQWPNVVSLEAVTSHGSPRWINRIQAETGLRLMSRVLRRSAHPRCRVRRTAIYGVDGQGPDGIESWLARVEQRYAISAW